jgi:hypothetical protein
VWTLPDKLPGSFGDFSSQDMILADKYAIDFSMCSDLFIYYLRIYILFIYIYIWTPNLLSSNVFRTFDTNQFPHIQYNLSASVEYRVEPTLQVICALNISTLSKLA